MTQPILVTGATGNLGRRVVALLRDGGAEVRLSARTPPDEVPDAPSSAFVAADLESGAGAAEAVAGVHTVVHLAGSGTRDGLKARNLVAAAQDAGIRHIVYISVVGADRIPVESRIDRTMFGFYAEKRAAELAIAQSGIPFTTLRATQFHDLTLSAVRAMAKLPIVPVPRGWRFQPVDADVVARRLAEYASSAAAVGLVPELGGREVFGMDELVRSYLASRGKRRPQLAIGTPGGAARAFTGGANLAPQLGSEGLSWSEFLAVQNP